MAEQQEKEAGLSDRFRSVVCLDRDAGWEMRIDKHKYFRELLITERNSKWVQQTSRENSYIFMLIRVCIFLRKVVREWILRKKK